MDKVLNINLTHSGNEQHFVPENLSMHLTSKTDSLDYFSTKLLNNDKSLLVSFYFKEDPIENITINTDYFIKDFSMDVIENGYKLTIYFLQNNY